MTSGCPLQSPTRKKCKEKATPKRASHWTQLSKLLHKPDQHIEMQPPENGKTGEEHFTSLLAKGAKGAALFIPCICADHRAYPTAKAQSSASLRKSKGQPHRMHCIASMLARAPFRFEPKKHPRGHPRLPARPAGRPPGSASRQSRLEELKPQLSKIWAWLKKLYWEGLRRFWSMCPFTRVPFWCRLLTHSHLLTD